MIFFKKNKFVRPVINPEDFSNFSIVADFVNWFLRNDKFVKSVYVRSSSIIFSEGIRPSILIGSNPDSYKSNIENISEWFIIKIYLDINTLNDYSESSFHNLMDKIDTASRETIITSGSFFINYNLNTKKFVFEKEILKIPGGIEREAFKRNFLDDNILSSELRILMWLYFNYFNSSYTQVYKYL